jgi:hypothetical protein
MNYDDIKDMTNEEAVAYFAPLTSSFIPCGDLENLLGFAGVAKRNAVTGAWEGSLIDFMQSNAVPALSEGLGELFSHLNKPRSIGCDTHEQPWASKMADLLAGLEMVGQIDAQFTADVVALAGGYVHADLDVDAVQALRDEEAARVAQNEANAVTAAAFNAARENYDALYNQHIAPLYDAADFSDAAWIAALNAMASNWSN